MDCKDDVDCQTHCIFYLLLSLSRYSLSSNVCKRLADELHVSIIHLLVLHFGVLNGELDQCSVYCVLQCNASYNAQSTV